MTVGFISCFLISVFDFFECSLSCQLYINIMMSNLTSLCPCWSLQLILDELGSVTKTFDNVIYLSK